MTDHSDLIAELRALADYDSRAGEPLGKCMRRAASALSSQSLSLSEAREEIERLRWENARLAVENDRMEVGINVAEAEIERLKGLVAGIRECPQETSGVETRR